MEGFVGLILLLGLVAAVYFLVIKPKQDEKKAATPVAPPKVVQSETVKTSAKGNPRTWGDRDHFRFRYTGSYYGKNIFVFFDGDRNGKWTFTVPDGSKRFEFAEDGRLWKPERDSTPAKTLSVLSAGAKASGVPVFHTCTIEFTG